MKKVACDTETTGLCWAKKDRPFGIGLWFDDDEWDYIDCPVDVNTRIPHWEQSFVSRKGRTFKDFKGILEDQRIPKIFHNAKFDLHMLRTIDIHVKGTIHDTVFASKVCNTLEINSGLKPLAKKYLNIGSEDEQILKKKVTKYRIEGKKKGWRCGTPFQLETDYWLLKALDPNSTECETYCVTDVKRTMGLWKFYEEGMKQLGVRQTYDFEINLLLNVVYPMEQIGIQCNEPLLNQRYIEIMQQIIELEKELKEEHGDINWDSPAQMREFIPTLGITITERTNPSKTYPNGQIKVSNQTLKPYVDNPVVSKILRRAALCTGRGYFKNYMENLTDLKTIHTSFNQSTTKTWRFSSNNPNLQNVTNPATNDNPFSVNGREVFGPRKGYLWIAIDYSQLELRIFASRAGEDKLIDAFNSGRDPHDETRLNVPFLAAKDKAIGRKLAKNTNFTVINCGGKNVLFKKYGIPLDEGEQCIKGFYAAYTKTQKRQREIAREGRLRGYIYNAFNRKLNVDPQFDYRATSYDIQSSAADLIKRAMIRLSAYIKDNYKPHELRMVLQIHDELVFEVHKSIYHPDMLMPIRDIMENNDGVFEVETPIEAKLIETNWSEKSEISIPPF